MKGILTTISIDAKTHKIINEVDEEIELNYDPTEEFYQIMAEEFINFMEGQAK